MLRKTSPATRESTTVKTGIITRFYFTLRSLSFRHYDRQHLIKLKRNITPTAPAHMTKSVITGIILNNGVRR